MDLASIIGNIAAILTSFSFIPQALKVIKSKDTHSISLPMYLMFVAGILMWLTYGFMINSVPLLLANTITILFSGIILFYKLRATLRQMGK